MFKWKRIILSIFLGVVLFVTLLAYAITYYGASSKVLVERAKAPGMRTEPQPGLEMAEVINTEISIVVSRTVMRNVVDYLKLHQRVASGSFVNRSVRRVREAMEAAGLLDKIDPREKWIASLIKDVRVKPVLDSNIFLIRYGHEDPVLAAAVVNAVTDEYLVHRMRIYSYQAAAEFYNVSVERARLELDRLENELKEYKERAALVAASVKKDGFVREMDSLRERGSVLYLELADVLAKYDEQHPKVALLRKKTEAMERRIAEIGRKLQDIERDEAKVQDLSRRIRLQEETYRSYKVQSDQAMLSAFGNKTMMNVHVVDRAEVPIVPYKPRLFYILVAAFAGAVLSISAAMICEYYDHRASTPERIEEALGVPVLGSVRKGAPMNARH